MSQQITWQPTLETIPPELKRKIALHAFGPSLILDENRWSHMTQLELLTRQTRIKALSLVSTSWADVLEEFRWQHIVIAPWMTDSLLSLARDVLPRIARHVEQISIVDFSWNSTRDEYDDFDMAKSPDGQELVAEAEAFLDLSSAQVPEDYRDLRLSQARHALAAHILEGCPHARSIVIEGVPEVPPHDPEDEWYPVKPAYSKPAYSDRFELALQHLGPKIEHVRLAMDRDDFEREEFGLAPRKAARYIELFPKAKSLLIDGLDRSYTEQIYDTEDRPATEALLDSLRSLTSLESLTLVMCDWLSGRILHAYTYPVLPTTLKHLALVESDIPYHHCSIPASYSPQNIAALTLVDRSCIGISCDILSFDSLRFLSIACQAGRPLFGRFDNSPLENIELCADGIFHHACVSSEEVIAFLAQHRQTLRSLVLHKAIFRVPRNAEKVAEWCAQNGVIFAIRPDPPVPDYGEDEEADWYHEHIMCDRWNAQLSCGSDASDDST
ncbi:hypothetical protein JCM10908_006749 [Rhodotorula pacifica]|uniref:uncharacterized protein n=1 Tax=Rhodotorula pacifica TaxID=1495444 RepID=UPI00317FADD0